MINISHIKIIYEASSQTFSSDGSCRLQIKYTANWKNGNGKHTVKYKVIKLKI
jgi:hypothetical protein